MLSGPCLLNSYQPRRFFLSAPFLGLQDHIHLLRYLSLLVTDVPTMTVRKIY